MLLCSDYAAISPGMLGGLGAGQALLEDQLGALVPALLRQIRHAPAAATRATAAECLLATMGLPYTLLHPHR